MKKKALAHTVLFLLFPSSSYFFSHLCVCVCVVCVRESVSISLIIIERRLGLWWCVVWLVERLWATASKYYQQVNSQISPAQYTSREKRSRINFSSLVVYRESMHPAECTLRLSFLVSLFFFHFSAWLPFVFASMLRTHVVIPRNISKCTTTRTLKELGALLMLVGLACGPLSSDCWPASLQSAL